MKYRDLLKAYKTGEVSEDLKKQIEADIEKQDAISEYLVDRMEETWEQEDDFAMAGGEPADESDESSGKITQMINSSIRKAFLKMGTVVLAVAIAVILFISFGLSPLVSAFYYNPDKTAIKGTSDENFDINQMSLDMLNYTSLTMPEHFRGQVTSMSEGYGRYNITIPQVTSYGSNMVTVGGNIERGKMVLYNENVFNQPSVTYFAGANLGGGGTVAERAKKETLESGLAKDEHLCYWYYDSRQAGREALAELQDNVVYNGYVSFNRDMTFREVQSFLNEIESYASCNWMGVRTGKKESRLLGYSTSGSYFSPGTGSSAWKLDGYPALNIYEGSNNDNWSEMERKNLTGEKWSRQHMISLLNYVADQEEFLKLFDDDSEVYRSAADYIEKNGLNYYGIVVLGDKAALQKLEKSDKVFGIIATEAE